MVIHSLNSFFLKATLLMGLLFLINEMDRGKHILKRKADSDWGGRQNMARGEYK